MGTRFNGNLCKLQNTQTRIFQYSSNSSTSRTLENRTEIPYLLMLTLYNAIFWIILCLTWGIKICIYLTNFPPRQNLFRIPSYIRYKLTEEEIRNVQNACQRVKKLQYKRSQIRDNSSLLIRKGYLLVSLTLHCGLYL